MLNLTTTESPEEHRARLNKRRFLRAGACSKRNRPTGRVPRDERFLRFLCSSTSHPSAQRLYESMILFPCDTRALRDVQTLHLRPLVSGTARLGKGSTSPVS